MALELASECLLWVIIENKLKTNTNKIKTLQTNTPLSLQFIQSLAQQSWRGCCSCVAALTGKTVTVRPQNTQIIVLVWAASVPKRCTSEYLLICSAWPHSKTVTHAPPLRCWRLGWMGPWATRQRADILGPFQPKPVCNSKSAQPTCWTRQVSVTCYHIHLKHFPWQHWHTCWGYYTFCPAVYVEPSCAFLVAAQYIHLRVPE